MRLHSRSVVLIGATITLLLIGGISAVGLYYLKATNNSMRDVFQVQYRKSELLQEMGRIARAREISIFSLYHMHDAWSIDEEYLHYIQLGSQFVANRDEYRNLHLSEYETENFAKALDLIRALQPVEEALATDLVDHKKIDVRHYFEFSSIPIQSQIQGQLDTLILYAREQSNQAQEKAQARYQNAISLFLWIITAAIITMVLVTRNMLQRITYYQSKLSADKALAEATVKAVAEGIIVTDPQHLVLEMNNAAEYLTGFNRYAAIGRHLSEIFHVRAVQDETPIDITTQFENISGPVCPAHRDLKIPKSSPLLVECTIAPILNENNELGRICYVFRDVTDERKRSEEMSWHAMHDPLTATYNRRAFEQMLLSAIHDVRNSKHTFALIYLDLDDFKLINDNYGHSAGDVLLVGLSRLMESSIRESDVLARIGGDEFAILLQGCPGNQAQSIARQLLNNIREYHFLYEDRLIQGSSASIGLVMLSSDMRDAGDALKRADQACYRIKKSGKNELGVSESRSTNG